MPFKCSHSLTGTSTSMHFSRGQDRSVRQPGTSDSSLRQQIAEQEAERAQLASCAGEGPRDGG